MIKAYQSCQENNVHGQTIENKAEKLTTRSRNQSKQVVKEVDFANFIYPTTKELSQVTGQSEITLNNGSITFRDSTGDISLLMSLSHVFWGNVTGNAKTMDAVVVLSYSMGGQQCLGVYMCILQQQVN